MVFMCTKYGSKLCIMYHSRGWNEKLSTVSVIGIVKDIEPALSRTHRVILAVWRSALKVASS